MVTKTYKCAVHGEFDVHSDINDKPPTICNKPMVGDEHGMVYCAMPVIRVYKKLTYMDAEGFCGKVYGCP